MTSITAPSTVADDQQRARRLPPDLLRRTNALLDKLDSLQAELERRRAVDDDKANTMREARTAQLHATIDAAVEQHRLQLIAWTGSATSRATWLRKRIAAEADKNDHTVVPGWRYVYEYIKTLQL